MGEGEEEGPYKGLGPPLSHNSNLNSYTDVSFDDSLQYYSPNNSFNNSNDMR